MKLDSIFPYRKSGETWLFDIGLAGESDGSVCHHKPVGHGTKIHGANLPDDIQEYPVHWVVFAPNIVIDANLGNSLTVSGLGHKWYGSGIPSNPVCQRCCGTL